MRLDDWFLTAVERGNPATWIDARHRGRAWTEASRVEVLIDGSEYFRRLHKALTALRPADSVYFTDWQGDGDELLDGPGTEIAEVLARLSRRGVDVRGLLWRSHPRQAHFAEQGNASLAKHVNAAGGEMILDERVRRGGSHHQKLVVIRSADGHHAFEGGIDLCHGRHDDSSHLGDRQAVSLSPRYGSRPPWHDVQLEVRGPAVGDLEHTFRERWQDPTPFDHRNPWRAALRKLTHQPRRAAQLPRSSHSDPPVGSHAVQVLRTYPSKRPAYPFAPAGERSVARGYLKAFRRARRLVYLEDQYLWSTRAAHALAAALEHNAELRVVAVVPRYPDRDGRATRAASQIGRARVIDILRTAGGNRVALYDLENADGTPIYVHAKVCVIDDVILFVGSDNINRRSWTHDSELSCSVIDLEYDGRAPADPGGLGDGARRLARDTRLRLWREHLERDDDSELIDPQHGFDALAASAAALDEWHTTGRRGPRPPGRLRRHVQDRVHPLAKWPLTVLYHLLLDPDGRPLDQRRHDRV
jgi:phosphatidylserine/phosphatidylglycerophosphate/cardiolipin synthase-like enzyme